MRNVINSTCECPAGASKKCKHIAATIYYINNEEVLSKTTVSQEWGKPSTAGTMKYKKGKTIEKLFPKKRKELCYDDKGVSHKSLVNNYDILSVPCILSKMIKEEQQYKSWVEIRKCIESILDEVEDHFDQIYMNEILTKQNECGIIFNCGSYFPLNLNDSNYYFSKIMINSSEIKNIFNKTKSQSNQCDLWNVVRNSRISASIKAHRIKSSKNLSFENQVSLAVSLLNKKSLGYQGKINVAYGNKYEETAVELYSNIFSVTIIKCGVIIHSHKPWLCASPDGIVIKRGQITKVLEVKCPISCRSKPIVDHVNKVCNVPYLKYESNKIVLKSSHQYFTQCQILMFCSGLEQCDLFVYNTIEPITVTVEKNILFLEKLITRLEYFYFNFYLPNIVSK